MSATFAEALTIAESLTTAERRELVELITLGLEGEPAEDQEAIPPLSEAWRREIDRRLAEYDAGLVQAIPWEEVKARLAARLADHG